MRISKGPLKSGGKGKGGKKTGQKTPQTTSADGSIAMGRNLYEGSGSLRSVSMYAQRVRAKQAVEARVVEVLWGSVSRRNSVVRTISFGGRNRTSCIVGTRRTIGGGCPTIYNSSCGLARGGGVEKRYVLESINSVMMLERK